jgi:hypothetical protein
VVRQAGKVRQCRPLLDEVSEYSWLWLRLWLWKGVVQKGDCSWLRAVGRSISIGIAMGLVWLARRSSFQRSKWLRIVLYDFSLVRCLESEHCWGSPVLKIYL